VEFYSSTALLRASACRIPRLKNGGIGLTGEERDEQARRMETTCVHTLRDHNPEFEGWKKDSVLVINLSKDSIAFEPARYPT
jgi:hypothetical protein